MDWTRGRTIGRGSTATVSIATDNGSGLVFAVKSSQLCNSEFLQREQRILSALASPHIVEYRGCEISSEEGGGPGYNLFLEYARDGTVADAIRERGGGGGLDDGRVRSYTRSILLGLEYLHSNGIVHCDIKSQNVLVAGDGAKVADFGCARRVDDVSSSDWSPTPIMGTPLYMAPEVARGDEQGFPSDVWALGCTVIEMATGRPPWVGLSDPVSALYRIGFSGDVPEIPKYFSKQAKDFVSKCLITNPKERWSARELLKHEFVNEPGSFSSEINNYNVESPISVLNQGLWDSMDEEALLETTWNSRDDNCSSCSNSPLERIGLLSGEKSSWEWSETWLIVRSNGNGNEQEHDHTNMLWAGELRGVSVGDTTIWVGEENDLDSMETSETIMCNTSSESNGSSSSWRHEIKSSVMTTLACKCTHHLSSSSSSSCRDLILRNKQILVSSSTITISSICIYSQLIIIFLPFASWLLIHLLSISKSQQF